MTDKGDKTSALVIRSSIKGRITKFKNYIDKLNNCDSLLNEQTSELALRLDRFRILFNNFDELQTQIEVSNPVSMQSEIDVREEIEHEFCSLIAMAQKLIDINKGDFASVQSDSPPHCNHHSEVNFRLPIIKIANFDGSYSKWLEFRDTFNSLIHRNERIQQIHKFHYLNSYLEGDAAQVITNLEVTESNYKEAWHLLCERYDNKKQLINNHLNSLFNIQPVGKDLAKDLRYLVDHVSKNLRALNTLGEPTEKWDTLVIHMVSAKLDSSTNFKWEECKNSYEEMPSLADFHKFLKCRADVVESVQRNKPLTPKVINPKRESSFSQKPPMKSFQISATPNASSAAPASCVFCSGGHRIYDCSSFLSRSIEDRISESVRLNLCLNCLRKGHTSHQCRLRPCPKCRKRHNALLHREVTQAVNTSEDLSRAGAQLTAGVATYNTNHVLLSTALIDVYNPQTGACLNVRCLLDSGSQTSLITSSLKQQLQLTPQHNSTSLVGIGNIPITGIPERCAIQIKSKHNKKLNFNVSCLVIPTLSGNMPQRYIDISHLKLPRRCKLADPDFNKPAQIDVLIGADIFWYLIEAEQITLGKRLPIMRKSKLGWLLSGPIYNKHVANQSLHNSFIKCNYTYIATNCDDLETQMTKFWELEQIPQPTGQHSDIESECEHHFITHTYRDADGRFCVRLPLFTEPNCLGNSYQLAKRRFIALEKRFKRNPNLKILYKEFIDEYAALGHLSESSIRFPENSYFVSHHAVLKPSSESTKIRVVFNGSAATTSGYSINDLQMIGPCIQDSLFNILVRFRTYKYVMTGDVTKMYRQISIQDCDRDLQLILWRDNENETLKTLRLNTVTYGFSSASYLSTRCLWQLGEDCLDPNIKNIIHNDFLVDDLITGANSENELLLIKTSVEKALLAGCFPLRKFRSNSSLILNNSQSSGLQDSLILSSAAHTLGVGWDSGLDVIHFPTQYTLSHDNPTKRSILSDACKIFDPLGLLSLLTIVPKIMIQKLWLAKIDWDESVPEPIKRSWLQFMNDLHSLRYLKIPRYVLCDTPNYIELHCFCDSSNSAYAACVYLKSTNERGDIVVRLLCAKARVSPVAPTTIPRLELCAAVLGSQLTAAVIRTLRCKIVRSYYWTDSSIVLAWLKTNHNKLKTFVSNRVAIIIELTDGSEWRHVPTSLNPADYASRGIDANKLNNLDIWWNGPTFLYESEASWPKLVNNKFVEDKIPELKINLAQIHEIQSCNTLIDFDRYSKLKHLQRSFAYLLRFLHNSRNPKNRSWGVLQPEELDTAFKQLIKISQANSFQIEIDILRKKVDLNSKSYLLSLSPFLDGENILRVGGRLNSSFYSFEKRHPMLLHAKHRLARLLFEREHLRLLHAGPQLMLGSIRETVWVIGGRDLARTVARQCVTCRRVAARTFAPIMGSLPPERVTPNFPFINVGIDFAGPFFITDRKGRGCKITKCYLAIFICSRFKCIHLEAVSQLSKEAFILSLRRFIARRGKPREIFCDNGRNFVAAAREISDFLNTNSSSITSFASDEGIKFKFQPAYAPHFGGLFESGVKSAKFHLKRILSNSHLTFEELATLFSQVEAILNSRPLCPLSSSPNDFQPLTPGHFLIGRALTALPSIDFKDANFTRLDRYQRLECIRQHFWKRWQLEYIAELQQRTKWRVPTRAIDIGDMVLVKDENAPPLHWRLGRIAKLYPGADGVTRVADVTTITGTYRRGVKYLCPLLDEPAASLKSLSFNGPQDVHADAKK